MSGAKLKRVAHTQELDIFEEKAKQRERDRKWVGGVHVGIMGKIPYNKFAHAIAMQCASMTMRLASSLV